MKGMNSMTFSGAASLIISGLAIWLSITFYKMSDASSKEVSSSTEKINTNVEKLEKMFNTMYADTFGMVKESVSHMRQQVDRSSYNIDTSGELKIKIDKFISEQLQEIKPDNLNKQDIKELILDVLDETKEFEKEIKKAKIKQQIISILKIEGEKTFSYLENTIIGENSKGFKLLFDVVYEMTQEGFLNAEFSYDFDENELGVSTNKPIKLLKER